MAIDTHFNPEHTPGSINDFGWYKVQRQTKTVLANMLRQFFDATNQVYKISIPEIEEVKNDSVATRTHIERDFPFFERKLPLIAVALPSVKEKKLYIGADNWSSTKVYTTSTGEKNFGYDFYSGMVNVPARFIIAGTSPEERMRLAEFVHICFTHFFRWQYIYEQEDGSFFSIVPATRELSMGGEQEISEQSNLNLIYITTVDMESLIEYSFRNNYLDDRWFKVREVLVDGNSGVIER